MEEMEKKIGEAETDDIGYLLWQLENLEDFLPYFQSMVKKDQE
jgi:hypothetical protein